MTTDRSIKFSLLNCLFIFVFAFMKLVSIIGYQLLSLTFFILRVAEVTKLGSPVVADVSS